MNPHLCFIPTLLKDQVTILFTTINIFFPKAFVCKNIIKKFLYTLNLCQLPFKVSTYDLIKFAEKV